MAEKILGPAARTVIYSARNASVGSIPEPAIVPACSTIHAVLDRNGVVTSAIRRRTRVAGTALSPGVTPNDLWCTDYKGEFMLGDRRYCSRAKPYVGGSRNRICGQEAL